MLTGIWTALPIFLRNVRSKATQRTGQRFKRADVLPAGIAWGQNVSFVQTLVWVFDFRSRRVAADGRRTASDGREAAFGGRSADRQRCRKRSI